MEESAVNRHVGKTWGGAPRAELLMAHGGRWGRPWRGGPGLAPPLTRFWLVSRPVGHDAVIGAAGAGAAGARSRPAPRPVAVSTAMIAASRRWANERPWQVLSRADSSSLVKTGTSFSVTLGAQPDHRVRDLFLLGEPAEELLQGPELVAGVGVAVAGQQVDQPRRAARRGNANRADGRSRPV